MTEWEVFSETELITFRHKNSVQLFETIQSFVPEDCDRNSSEIRTVGIENWASDDYLDNFFDNGEALL